MCHHDVILDNTTNVAEHKEFADRKRTYEVEGVNMTGLFICMLAFLDFLLKRSIFIYLYLSVMVGPGFKVDQRPTKSLNMFFFWKGVRAFGPTNPRQYQG